jgi:topoisomerase IA-like protein
VKVSLPDQTEFDDLSPEAVAALLAGSTPRLVGHIDDVPLYIKVTKTSSYFQLGEKGNLPEGHKKPRTAGLLKSMNPDSVTVDDAVRMFALPRVVGVAANGETITVTLGKFGGYISCGGETRSLKDDEQIFSITVAEAQALLDTPKKERRGKWKKKG